MLNRGSAVTDASMKSRYRLVRTPGAVISFIGMNQERYFANRDIYGDFRDRLTRIKKLWGV